MINDEKDLSETPSNTTAELILLGYIINNMSLLEQYGSCLQKNDFHDKPNRILYDFLCDYYRNFGTEYSKIKSIFYTLNGKVITKNSANISVRQKYSGKISKH